MKIFSVFVLGFLIAIQAVSAPNPKPVTAEELVDSPQWSCRMTHKVILSVGDDGALGNVPAVCIAKARCDGLGTLAGSWREFGTSCPTVGPNKCPDLNTCVGEGQASTRTVAWSSAMAAKAKRRGLDKYGRNCVYVSAEPRVIYRDGKDGSLDEVCTTQIACNHFNEGPKHFVVACPKVGIVKAEDADYTLCPQVNDCIDNELPLSVSK